MKDEFPARRKIATVETTAQVKITAHANNAGFARTTIKKG